MKEDCDTCQFGSRFYADGLIKRDWSGVYEGEHPTPRPDPKLFWTYQECSKNSKGLKHLNLTGNCSVYKECK